MASPLSRRELSDFSLYCDDDLMKGIPLGRQSSLDVAFQVLNNDVTHWTETNAPNASPRSNNNDFLSWTDFVPNNQVNLGSNDDDFSEIAELVKNDKNDDDDDDDDEKKKSSTSMKSMKKHLRRNTDPVETNNLPASHVAPVVQGSKKRSHDTSFLPTGPNTGEEFDQQVDDYQFNVDCLNISIGKDPCKFCVVGGKKNQII